MKTEELFSEHELKIIYKAIDRELRRIKETNKVSEYLQIGLDTEASERILYFILAKIDCAWKNDYAETSQEKIGKELIDEIRKIRRAL